MSEVEFTPQMYEAARGGAQASARVIVPLALRVANAALARMERGGSVQRVIDVGCGEGWFTREFAERGIPTVTGYDASITPSGGENEHPAFYYADLTGKLTFPQADLAVCLEVAEHLPESAAGELVSALCAAAPIVLFSAAIPGQGGWGHVNCQWPGYWVDLFKCYGFGVSGALRSLLWGNEHVESWYQQNLLVASSNPAQVRNAIDDIQQRVRHDPIPLVHPDIWLAWVLPDAERP